MATEEATRAPRSSKRALMAPDLFASSGADPAPSPTERATVALASAGYSPEQTAMLLGLDEPKQQSHDFLGATKPQESAVYDFLGQKIETPEKPKMSAGMSPEVVKTMAQRMRHMRRSDKFRTPDDQWVLDEPSGEAAKAQAEDQFQEKAKTSATGGLGAVLGHALRAKADEKDIAAADTREFDALQERADEYNSRQGLYDNTFRNGTRRVKVDPLDLSNMNDAQRTALDFNTVITRAVRADRRWRKSGGELTPEQEQKYYDMMADVRGIDADTEDYTAYGEGERPALGDPLLTQITKGLGPLAVSAEEAKGTGDVPAKAFGPGAASKLSPNLVNALNSLDIEVSGDIDNYRNGKALFSAAELKALGKSDTLEVGKGGGRTKFAEVVSDKNEALTKTSEKLKQLLGSGDMMLRNSVESLGMGLATDAEDVGGTTDALLTRGNRAIEPAMQTSLLDAYAQGLQMVKSEADYLELMRQWKESADLNGIGSATFFSLIDSTIDQQERGAADGVTNSRYGMALAPKLQRAYFNKGMKELR